MKWIDQLKVRWKVSSAVQVIVILIVFACTGITVVYLKRPALEFLISDEELPLWISVTYYILILPVYNILLLFYGLIFGQFNFFWTFEKQLFQRLLSIFKKY